MLITLKHLLVLILLLSGAGIVGVEAAKSVGLDDGISLIVLALSYILVLPLLGWSVFKLLCLRPLILPMCQSCGRRHGNYHIPRDAWPAAVVICIHCSKPLRLALTRGARSASSELPTVMLRWPGFLGLWKRVGQ